MSIKRIYKRIPANTTISSLSERTMPEFIISLRDDPNINEVSMGTYVRDLKTILRFFMKCEYLPFFEISIPKTAKRPEVLRGSLDLDALPAGDYTCKVTCRLITGDEFTVRDFTFTK